MNPKYLQKVYKYDHDKHRYEIEISLDYYRELFHDWDAAPLRKRDLDPELVEYLENAAEDIPLKEDVAIVFIMPKGVHNLKMEDISKQVFINFFVYLIHLNQRDLRQMLRQSIMYLVTGFVFVSLAYLTSNYTSFSFEVLQEGLFIGGWVFIWEAISLLVFKSSGIRKMVKRYQRFTTCEIIYKYKS